MKTLDARITYYGLAFVSSLLFSMVFVVTSLYEVTVAGLQGYQLVLVGTALEVSILLFEIPTGVIADTRSRKLSIILGFFLIGLGFVLEGSFPAFLPILLAQVIAGLGFTFTSGATQAWLSDEIGEVEANQAILKGNKYDLAGALAGLLLAIPLGGSDLSLPIKIGGGMLMISSLLLIRLMPETGFSPAKPENRSNLAHMLQIFKEGLSAVKDHPNLLTILGVGFVFGLYSEGWDRLWVKYLLDNFSISETFGITEIAFFGLLRSGSLILSIIATHWVEKRIDTGSTRAISTSLFSITAMLASSIIVFAISPILTLCIAAYAMVSITRNLTSPLMTAWVNNKLDPKTRATVLSISGQVDAIGQVGSGPIAAVISLISLPLAISFAGVLLIPALPLIKKVENLSTEEI